MAENIQKYLDKKQREVAGLKHSPIISRWINSPHMEQDLAILDSYVEYLLNNGASKKVKQWLLSGDENFNALAAERFIINYLKQRNRNLTENLGANGIDGYINNGNAKIGIEVTTLNGDVASWILTERLTQLLDEKGFLNDKGLDISYSLARICSEANGKRLYAYIQRASLAITSNDSETISNLNLSVKIRNVFPGTISWQINDGVGLSWLQDITEDLFGKLQAKSKVKQLKKHSKNLVFVGVNHLSPSNGNFPRVFKELGTGGTNYATEINRIKEYWLSEMPKLNNVIGICYFFYPLDRTTPFYLLKVFWRSDTDEIPLNL